VMVGRTESSRGLLEPPDICRRRHLGSETSRLANQKANPAKREKQTWCLRQIRRQGRRGMTSYELLALANGHARSGKPVSIHRITPRLSELAKLGLIVQPGETRDNADGNACHVWVAREFMPGFVGVR